MLSKRCLEQQAENVHAPYKKYPLCPILTLPSLRDQYCATHPLKTCAFSLTAKILGSSQRVNFAQKVPGYNTKYMLVAMATAQPNKNFLLCTPRQNGHNPSTQHTTAFDFSMPAFQGFIAVFKGKPARWQIYKSLYKLLLASKYLSYPTHIYEGSCSQATEATNFS